MMLVSNVYNPNKSHFNVIMCHNVKWYSSLQNNCYKRYFFMMSGTDYYSFLLVVVVVLLHKYSEILLVTIDSHK